MRSIFLLFNILLISVHSNFATQDCGKPKWLAGEWYGEGFQPNALTDQVWSIELSYSLKEKTIKVGYPSLSCGGTWTISKVEKNRVVLMEKLDFGHSFCLDNSKIVVTRTDENYLSVAFYNPDQTETVIAIGLLWKKQGSYL